MNKKIISVAVLIIIVLSFLSCAHNRTRPNSARNNGRTLSIDTNPTGARMEIRGQTLGTTPYEATYPGSYFQSPRTVFSSRLEESMVATFYKEGYYPKTVELTHGPFLWTSLNGANHFVYYTLDYSYYIQLEPLPETIAKQTKKQGISFGTGFHCNSYGYFVTNYHVIDEASTITILGGNNTCPATVVASDKNNDLAILKVDKECAQRLGLSDPLFLGQTLKLQQGQDVVTYGYPLPTEFAGEPQISVGIVKSTYGVDGDTRMLTISNSIQPGNSGGPLFGPDGNVVGVVTSSLSAKYLYPRYEVLPQDLNFAVKSEYVRLLFELHDIKIDNKKISKKRVNSLSITKNLPAFISKIKGDVVLVGAEQK